MIRKNSKKITLKILKNIPFIIIFELTSKIEFLKKVIKWEYSKNNY